MCTLFRLIFIDLQNVGVISAAPYIIVVFDGHNNKIISSGFATRGSILPQSFQACFNASHVTHTRISNSVVLKSVYMSREHYLNDIRKPSTT